VNDGPGHSAEYRFDDIQELRSGGQRREFDARAMLIHCFRVDSLDVSQEAL
jgi:hypothetical protein